ncbi:MAG: polysaccharide biosynthesis/export family protein, partial [Desulfobulbaceae bacterium]|nr:polysaccharide biosynthesis/export family protein [Desulfobulbaceae bacterium]
MTKKILLTILTILLLSVPAFGQDYIVGEDDVLKVMVYDHDDMTTTVRVSGDGTIILPLLNRINVAGMTITAISEKVSKLLADGYIVNPQVNMFIEEFRSKKVVILGQVNKPGLYELSGETSLLELISKAGGLTKDAGGTTSIKRKTVPEDADRNDVLTIDMTRLIEKGDTSQNVMMMSGDNVYIE